MSEAFTANIPQAKVDIEEALRSGLLSLDANVLLNFYRYSPNARDALVAVLGAAGDRVWVSHQAAREFWRNRCAAIDSRSQATEQLRTVLEKGEATAVAAVDSWSKQTAVPEDIKQRVKAALADGFGQAREQVESEVQGSGAVSYDAAADSVLAVLVGLLSANVGPPLSAEKHAEALAEGARRATERIPPGYRDAEKADGDGPDGSSGDYLVWLQSIEESLKRDLSLVIITGDEKDDWWWKHRNTFMGPRSELVEEFARRSTKRLYLLRPVQLIEHAAVLDVSVPEGAVTDVARTSSDRWESYWTPEGIAELLKRLDREGREQADVIRFAARDGGEIDRQKIYEIAGYDEDRMLRGFTRPAARITRQLQDEGLLGPNVDAALTPFYDGGVTAARFAIPAEVVEILCPPDSEHSSPPSLTDQPRGLE